MLKRQSGVLAQSLLAACLCATPLTPTLAQGRGSIPNNAGIPLEAQLRTQEIEKIIDRSDERLQAAEIHLKQGDYNQARRAYDRAVDIILESGIDVRTDARLQRHYQALVEYVFQRQVAAHKQAAPAVNTQVASNATSLPQSPSGVAQQERPAESRGFGQQLFEPSPLDELGTLKLTDEETRGATEAEARSAVANARLDFGFRPNGLIQAYINYYTGRGRATMESGLRRSGRFMTMARKIFREEGVPQDIAWLGQVESAWSPIARSWAAAVGLWQFIPSTGMRYGLRQDYWVDERQSFEKATRASARYLKWLADRYAGNWELAMAAYNSGEGRVDGAIARSGYADFWEIYNRGLLPNETRNYVPNILATIIIAKNPEQYGFSVKPEPPLAFDLVKVNNAVDLHLIADACDSSHDYLLALNPELKRGVTPPGLEHVLRVPAGKGKGLQTTLARIPPDKRATWRLQTATGEDTFATIALRTGVSETTLAAINGGEITPGQKVIIPATGGLRNVAAVAPAGAMVAGAAEGAARIIAYKVRPGENLGDIAARYSSSVRDIAALNRISPTTRVRAGQVLKVPVRPTR